MLVQCLPPCSRKAVSMCLSVVVSLLLSKEGGAADIWLYGNDLLLIL